MKSKLFLLVFVLAIGFFSARAQSTRDSKPNPPAPAYQSQKKAPKKFLGIFKKKEPSTAYKTDEEEAAAFRERLKKVYKQKAKDAKEGEKPQYSDKSYFGHKKPPKKRPPDKMKFCKECGIKH